MEGSTALQRKYKMLTNIGKGGQGTVFLAQRRDTNDLFACKTTELGAKEVKFLNHLCGLPGVPKLYEVYRDSSCHMILELCDGSMRKRLQRVGALSEREAALFLKQLAIILDEVHYAHVIHRDLKCENILLTAEAPPYNVKLADFGCAAFCTSGSTVKPGVFSGTHRYCSPEGARGVYSSASDVWGLGMILYECLSGSIAFKDRSSDIVQKQLLAGIDLPTTLDWSKISEGAKKFIMEMLQLDPNKRLSVQQIIQHPWIVRNQATMLGKRKSSQVQISRPEKVRKLFPGTNIEVIDISSDTDPEVTDLSSS